MVDCNTTGMDQLGVLTLGTLVPKEGQQSLFLITLLAFRSWYRKPPFIVNSVEVITAEHVLVRHVANKAPASPCTLQA